MNADSQPIPPTEELPIEPTGPRRSPSRGRFAALAAAVRAHRVVTGHSAVAIRPSDHERYRRLGEIEASWESGERE